MALTDFLVVLGGRQMLLAFVQLKREIPRKAQRNLFGNAEDVMAESQRITPLEFGRLRATGFVRRVGRDVIELGYGTSYAIFVHEIPPPEEGAPHPDQLEPGTRTAHHKPPTTWKFLQRPAEAAWGNIAIEFRGRGNVLRGIRWPKV